MGIMNKKLIPFLAEATKNCKANKKQLIMSVVSLFMAVVILVATTFCWFCLQEAETTGTLNVDAGNGLRLNYNNDNSSKVEITENMVFKPVSSVMGQNLYFPSDGGFFTESNIIDKTKEITYRSATAGDKNVFFLQYDFSLTAFADDTEVFMDPDETHIYYRGKSTAVDAMRVAFIYDNGKGSVIMNPTQSNRTVEAVEVANYGTGECISTSPQVSQPFKYYTAGQGHELFKMQAGENQKISVVIWLEGTDPECKNKIIGNDLDINIKFTTTWNDMDEIRFVDVSTDKWINTMINDNSQLQLVYTDAVGNEKLYDLTKAVDNNNTYYVCKIPKSIDSGLTFRLTHNGTRYTWDTEPDNVTSSQYRAKNTTYYATGTEAAPRGYWKYSGDEGDNNVPVDTFPSDIEDW
ncbi:MAG: hypothetical protein ACI4RM_00955 [Ruminococcus sp.]